MPSPGSLAEREEAFGPPPRPALDIAFADSSAYVVTPKRIDWRSDRLREQTKAYGPFESFSAASDWLHAQPHMDAFYFLIVPLVAPEHRDLSGAWLGEVTEPEDEDA